MNTQFKVGILFLLLLTFSIPSSAADKGNATSAFIFSGGRGTALNGCKSPWLTDIGALNSECSENSTIYRMAYNYKLTPNWAVEISGGDLARPNVKGVRTGSPSHWEMKIDGWTIAGIGILPMGKSFSLFGKLGYVRSHFREKIGVTINGVPMQGVSFNGVKTIGEDRNGLTYGAGFQIDFTNTFGLRFQYENFGQYDVYSAYGVSNPDKISISTVSAGLVFNL